MWFPLLVRWHLYIESGPWLLFYIMRLKIILSKLFPHPPGDHKLLLTLHHQIQISRGYRWINWYLTAYQHPGILPSDTWIQIQTLQWRHNERDGVSNHQPYDCLLSRLFRRKSKKPPKLHVTGLCAVTVELMVTRSGLNHAPRRGQRCSVKLTTWQHPIHK